MFIGKDRIVYYRDDQVINMGVSVVNSWLLVKEESWE